MATIRPYAVLRYGGVFFRRNNKYGGKKVSTNLEEKKQVVEEITGKIKDSRSVVLVQYSGLTVAEVTALRSEFRKAGVDYKVLKNTLVRKAFNGMGIDSFDEDLNGPTAVAFGSDEISAAKIIAGAQKKLNDKIAAKSAYVDGEYLDKDGVKVLAAIPSKEALIAKMLGSMQSPITKFAGVLSATLRSVVLALNAVAEKKAAAAQ